MRYLPKSPADRQQMLREIGVSSIDELFSHIPAEYRLNRDLKVTRAMSEAEIIEYFQQCAAESAAGYADFLGAGAYNHYRPVVIDSLVSRGEFFTAYTPYQAEISQGTLQTIFEFQTMICELTGMEVANVPYREDGRVDADMMERALNDQTACVVIQSPNFFGTLEDIELLAEAAHRHGALLIVAIAESASLGIVRPPAEADIVAMEAQ